MIFSKYFLKQKIEIKKIKINKEKVKFLQSFYFQIKKWIFIVNKKFNCFFYNNNKE